MSFLKKIKWYIWQRLQLFYSHLNIKNTEFKGEFGQECLSAIPYAYYLYSHNNLNKSVSAEDSACLYYFSPKHIELSIRRDCLKSNSIKIPNSLHQSPINTSRWLPPPYKKIYQNNEFIYSKPILVIANKYNSEWGQEPVNFFDLDMLRQFFTEFGDDYQIIYNRYVIENDNSTVYDLRDYKMIANEFPRVISMIDLHKNTSYSYNELQLRVYANCDHFISVQGGASILASYFGGTNCIYAKQGFELTSSEFDLVYPLLSQAKIKYVNFKSSELEHIKLGKLKIPYIQKNIKNDFLNLVQSTIAQPLKKVSS